ncbi:MAG: nucleotide exchange factor GrpE [Parcubacteria group bacterium CG08_land_8_20_14_0_20_48_21]|nr:MAG: nucleotide exchange factor GrpE [Parcubacteria group bacterium CG2_30_48_51]PIS32814.1 MAG: nucleotide exchange factor GrpE [Parcubacteria group bacterium CG08_land_8_20_14_0_20_48_21]PIW79334.1 MAG: nucleotide exchange factor GrpE [Parcubacteria group bacterium CG_4_8_14_3_um_filter_48_16]PIY78074.1 MAG: nucleotide exchange factor GrpE [Parcubacteria group bacterium CG_4_10_14_0_8_um_filter_48_154]PIZ76915.1 MAG: nucleotide exchange factor GrpE [bacterium CG_4_10_14_0_2_um_filter_48_14
MHQHQHDTHDGKKSQKIEKELLEAQKKCAEYLAGWKRAQADYQNLKKETEIQKAAWIKFAHDQIITELLPVYDNFKMSLMHVPDNQRDSQWVVGLTHIKTQMQHVLQDNGVAEIQTVGKSFNPENHEAIEAVATNAYEPDIIVEELKPGYTLHDKVIQAAKVKVAKGKDERADGTAANAS